MTKPQQASTLPSASTTTLPTRAIEALQQQRFKDAIELFKQLVRQDARSEWRESLADAYAGRARALASKGMFKEAAIVLENTFDARKILREPQLYVSCLIREGQQPKAGAYLLHCAANNALPAELEDLTAALLLTVPQLPTATGPEAARWRDLAIVGREALAAWIDGASPEVIERHIARISLRSAFRPVRLLLKSLISLPPDAERSRRLLESIAPDSPFFALRRAVEAATRADTVRDADAWKRLTGAQQSFVAETGGLAPTAVQSVSRLSDAARSGPGSLFTWLLKQTDLPPAELRSACLNLLPQVPDRLPQFEKTFGSMSEPERTRIKALTAEARSQWDDAEQAWCELAGHYAASAERIDQLSAGVIYRHLAALAREHRRPRFGRDPAIGYLEHSGDVDPSHIPTVLARIAYYRQTSRDKDWHRLADEAVQRCPDDSQVLQAALQSTLARQAYKKATDFARRLLQIDPINTGVRRQMIELQIAYARKQMRAKRPDLAAKALPLATEWDRADAPSAALRIARGLVAQRAGETEQADIWLREGVALAGGGVAGWFCVVLEAELMKSLPRDIKPLKAELTQACQTPATKSDIMAIAAILTQSEAIENKRTVSKLLASLRGWLQTGFGIVWKPEEFQTFADALLRLDAYDVLHEHALAAHHREPGNPEWRFQEIFARLRGNGRMMSYAEMDHVKDMADAAIARKDAHDHNRLLKFLEFDPFGGQFEPDFDDDTMDDLDDVDEAEIVEMLGAMMSDMPKDAADSLRSLVKEVGREAAIELSIANFRSSPGGESMPEPLLRVLCEQLVEAAMARPAAKRRRK